MNVCHTREGPKDLDGLMEQPSMGSRKRWAIITDLGGGVSEVE